MASLRCPKCCGQGEVPVGVTFDFDSGMWECDDVKQCPRCKGSGRVRSATVRAPVGGHDWTVA